MLTEPVAFKTLLEAAPLADEDDADEGDAIDAPVAPAPAPVLMTEAETDALFAKLFAQYEQPIFQYAYRLLGDAEDARDFTGSPRTCAWMNCATVAC